MKLFYFCLLFAAISAYSISSEEEYRTDDNDDDTAVDNGSSGADVKQEIKPTSSDSKSTGSKKSAETKSSHETAVASPSEPSAFRGDGVDKSVDVSKTKKGGEKVLRKNDIMELVGNENKEATSDDDKDEPSKENENPDPPKDKEEDAQEEDNQQEQNEKEVDQPVKASPSEYEKAQISDEEAPFVEEGEQPEAPCNIQYQKVGCYKSKDHKLGFQNHLSTDPEAKHFSDKGKVSSKEAFNSRLPQMVCDCAKAALDAGNAIFSLKNIAECWTGPDNTIYDKEGPSKKCVTFDNENCDDNSPLCSGKKHANFVYFVDSPEHTKSTKEIQEELAAEEKKVKAFKKKGKQHKKGRKLRHGKKKNH